MQCTFDNTDRPWLQQFHLKTAENNAEAYLKKENFDGLQKLLTHNVTESMFRDSPYLDYSRIKLCWHKGDFEWCKYYLQNRKFPEPYHRELQLIWNDCLYKDFEKQTGRIPCHTERWRIRARQRLPFTIWDGLPIKYSYRVQDIEVLEKQFRINRYPTIQTKKYLVSKTYLSPIEVEKWFRNRRGREGRKRIKGVKEETREENKFEIGNSYSTVSFSQMKSVPFQRSKSLDDFFMDNLRNQNTIVPALDFDSENEDKIIDSKIELI